MRSAQTRPHECVTQWTTTQIPRSATSSGPEDLFVELFTQVFGVENVRLLTPEFAVEDIYGGSRFVDFASTTVDERVAFEIDGLTWHVPDAERIAEYEDQLLRQNSLVHQGWRVFRWTDRQIAERARARSRSSSPSSWSGSRACWPSTTSCPKQHGEVHRAQAAPGGGDRGPGTAAGRGEHDRAGDPCRARARP